jgi:hypothetical protein
MNQTYINAVRLLLVVAPVVCRKPLFALKGGTAINLFIRDMPRLSVDLDLVCTCSAAPCCRSRTATWWKWHGTHF